MANGTGPGDWAPVRDEERIEILDTLRGFAVLGILLANVSLFAFPSGAPGIPAGGSPADQAAALLVGLLVEGKFYTIFSLLFGMGLMLQSRRAAERGKPFAGFWLRRMAILLLMGMVHAVFLFSADILAFYALIGMAALPFRRLKPAALLACAASVLVVGLSLHSAYGFANPRAPLPTGPDWAQLAEGPAPGARTQGRAAAPLEASALPVPAVLAPFLAGAPALAGLRDEELYRFMAAEERVFRSGAWEAMARHRAVSFLLVSMPLRMIFLSWQVLWLFLLGMAFAQWSFLQKAGGRPGFYRRLIGVGLPVGALLQALGAGLQMALPGRPALVPAFWLSVYAATLLMGLSYVGAVALLSARAAGTRIVRSLAAVGRTAVTNYVGQSVVCGFLFYGWGLGWFGQLGRVDALLLAFTIFGLQMLLSTLWLRSFRFGPLEWVWRTLSYGRLQPMLR